KQTTGQPQTTSTTNNTGEKADQVFDVNAEDLLKDYMKWYTYTYYNVRLAQDFIGLDVDSSVADKSTFLYRLSTGTFIPVKIMTRNNMPVYKLYKPYKTNEEIKNTIKQMAAEEIAHYKMEGQQLPDYNFTDLNGKIYNKSTTRGKLVVIKCWFIRCVACVKEFPELNKLVDEYKDRSDILFVSLATDSKEDLQAFLKKKQFNYAVVPSKEKYMLEELNITSYPTHILVDKEGKIVKVVNAIEDLAPFIKRQTGKEHI
ncbi:MAG: hypothetical protein JWQ96_1032, partial [Segetibacter sp.]|nr:hypothetical protein [Segetibacter sp.]